MIYDIVQFMEQYSNVINLVCYIIVFLGGFYVALHSRILPNWAVTCIWYIGVSSLFVASTIVVEWTVGQTHPLSHFMIGKFGEIIMNLNIAIMVGLLFFHTIYQDYKAKSKRKTKMQEDERIAL